MAAVPYLIVMQLLRMDAALQVEKLLRIFGDMPNLLSLLRRHIC